MSIRFAPAVGSLHDLSVFVRAGSAGWRARMIAANDNRGDPKTAAFDPGLIDALRHFANHGLAAAPAAQRAATAALAAGDSAQFRRWVEVTRCFDQRLALQTERTAVDPVT
jgi:hypothetical protein